MSALELVLQRYFPHYHEIQCSLHRKCSLLTFVLHHRYHASIWFRYSGILQACVRSSVVTTLT